MIRFPSLRRASRPSLVASLALLLLAAGGCQEILTYNNLSRRKGLEEYRQANYTVAAGSFQTATAQDPRDYRSFYDLGRSYDKLGNSQQAIQAYRSALRVMRTTPQGRANKPLRAEVLDALAQTIARANESATTFEIPDDNLSAAEAQWLRGKCSRYGGDPDGAIEGYQQARMLEPDNFHLNKDFGLYMESLGQRQLASPALRRANALDGEDEEVASALGRLGVAPGPGLKLERELAKPPLPKGPIPPVQNWQVFGGGRRDPGTGGTPDASWSPPAADDAARAEPEYVPRETFTPVDDDGTSAAGPRD